MASHEGTIKHERVGGEKVEKSISLRGNVTRLLRARTTSWWTFQSGNTGCRGSNSRQTLTASELVLVITANGMNTCLAVYSGSHEWPLPVDGYWAFTALTH